MYGVDVSVRRHDDLDRACVSYLESSQHKLTVLDLGCGEVGVRELVQECGHEWQGVDIVHTAADCAQQDIRSFVSNYRCPSPTVVVLQRALHYLSYEDASILLRTLSRESLIEKLFLSVTGKESAIGEAHEGAERPLTERLSPLPADAQVTFSIYAPLMVYSQAEVVTLLEESGWKVERVWSSIFMNHKVIASRDI